MLRIPKKPLLPNPFSTHRGFTLLEIVIAIALMILITAVIMLGLGPWLKFKQRMETDIILKDLEQATTALYKAHAFTIDDAPINAGSGLGAIDGTLGMASSGGLTLTAASAGTPTILASTCDTYNTAGGALANNDTSLLVPMLKPLQPYLAKPLDNVVLDGFNNRICVLVSPRLQRNVNGVPIFYHAVAFIAVGDNGHIDGNTKFDIPTAPDGDVLLKIDPDGDDMGRMVDGFGIALTNYKVTQERLAKLAHAYETYFNIRFLTKDDRDITINYFYANDGQNNGDPGDIDPARDPGPLMVQTLSSLSGGWDHSTFNCVLPDSSACADWPPDPSGGAMTYFSASRALGIADSDARDAWGRPITIDNRSARVKAGAGVIPGLGDTKLQPPFSATFGAFLPGTGEICGGRPSVATDICPTFVTMTAVGKY